MNIEGLVRKVLDRPDFKLPDEIPFGYFFKRGLSYFLGRVRGAFIAFSLKNTTHLFVGKHVEMMCKEKINLGDHSRIDDNVKIDGLSKKGIVSGNRLKIGGMSEIICSGSIQDLGVGITFGDDCNFSEYTFFGAAGGIKIGSDVIAGQNVRFHSEEHKFHDLDILIRKQGVTRKGIRIGNNVWIGAGAVFLDGVEVGDGCVIGANAVLKGSYPKNSVIVGTPARVVKKRG